MDTKHIEQPQSTLGNLGGPNLLCPPRPRANEALDPTARALWEILVPTTRNDGRPFKLRYHRVWDTRVRVITGGLTILSPTRGQWVYQDTLFAERMIPVRILATRSQIDQIIDLTLAYYDQLAVLAYRISDCVIMRTRDSIPGTSPVGLDKK